MKPIILILTALVLAGFAGCSRHSSATTPKAETPKVAILGVVEVVDGVESRHDMGNGKTCVIHPTVLKDGTVKLSMTIEEQGPAGMTQKPVLQVITWPDRAVEIESAGTGVSLTPHIKS